MPEEEGKSCAECHTIHLPSSTQPIGGRRREIEPGAEISRTDPGWEIIALKDRILVPATIPFLSLDQIEEGLLRRRRTQHAQLVQDVEGVEGAVDSATITR
jgi:hypothetical protein